MPNLHYCSTGPSMGSTYATGSCPGICNHHRNLKTWVIILFHNVNQKVLPQVPGQVLSISWPLSVYWRQWPLSAWHWSSPIESSQGGARGLARSFFSFGVQPLFLQTIVKLSVSLTFPPFSQVSSAT